MNVQSTALLICYSFFISSCQAQALQESIAATAPTAAKKSENAGRGESIENSLDAKLLNDLSRTDYFEVANEWSKLYDQLDVRFKNTVHTSDSEYAMDFGDLYGLNKGFSWGLCGNYIDNELGDAIVDGFGATGGKSKTEEASGYRAGMVYFYVKYQLLECE
jgi:hypothetical protein